MRNKLTYSIFTMLAFLIANIQSIEAAAPNPPLIFGAPVELPPVEPPSGLSNPDPVSGKTWVVDFAGMSNGYQPSHGKGDSYLTNTGGNNSTHVVSNQATVSGKALQVDFHSSPCDHNGAARSGLKFNESETLSALRPGSEFWYRTRIRLEPGFVFSNVECGGESAKGYHKFLRFQLNENDGGTTNGLTSHLKYNTLDINGSDSERAFTDVHKNASSGNSKNNIPINIGDHEWHTIEWYFNFRNGNMQAGDIKIWVDGKRTFTSLAVNARLMESNGSTSRIMIMDWVNGGVSKDQSAWIGDVVYSIDPPYVDSKGFPFIGK